MLNEIFEHCIAIWWLIPRMLNRQKKERFGIIFFLFLKENPNVVKGKMWEKVWKEISLHKTITSWSVYSGSIIVFTFSRSDCLITIWMYCTKRGDSCYYYLKFSAFLQIILHYELINILCSVILLWIEIFFSRSNLFYDGRI